ncbi:MAG: TraR/DksA C4-type zinc finger protein [Planctomycetota bacterium]|jgi:RNA polymerase-binding transcription factor DksA|nr:TraR/DksA C4-type zinc finger protein [Planctomycetota bacterium]
MKKLTKTQQKKYLPVLLDILKQLGVKLERMEDAVLLGEVDSSGSDGDDIGGQSYTRDMQLSLLENEDEILKATQAAVKRIEDGVFGTCMACKDLIPPRRLEVLPYSSYCVGCQEKSENGSLEI